MIRNKMAEMKTEKTERNRNGGFTIVETLVVASIIVVFLAFGMVGILRYRDYLRITELDNMARSIYVAAQNRAVLLDNDRRFQTLVGECTKVTLSDSGKERWYIDSGDLAKKSVLDDLLPMGTIDPALRNGRFYIVYEPASASVTDVFYVEKPDYDLKTFKSGIVDALNEMGADDKRENRMTNKPVMVGWFGSNGAAGRDKTLPGPSVDVLIENGNELTLTVKYTMPADLPVDANVTCWANVTLKYGNKEVKLLEMIPSGDTVAVSSPFFERLTDDTKNNNITAANHAAESCTYTWVLDSLADHVKSDDTKVPRQFKGIDNSFNPGGDFTVTASLKLTADGYQDSIEVKAEDTDNSLFAADTHDDDTAYIANLRHLQNLDTAYSGVNNNITKAEQIADIADAGTLKDNKGNEIEVAGSSEWAFKPIENANLLYYQDHRTKEGEAFALEPFFIKNLNVTEASAVGKKGAGLFSEVEDNFKFQNVRLMESEITGSAYAGGLAGYCNGSVTFANCAVEDMKVTGTDGSVGSAGGLAGSGKAAEGGYKATFSDCTVKGATDTAKITGLEHAGGLVGYWADTAEFTNCGAEKFTVESSAKAAGGLAGSGGTVTLSDCTVKGDTGTAGITGYHYAGGMVGQWTDTAAFTRCSAEDLPVTSSAGTAGGLAGSGKTATFTDNCTVKGVTGTVGINGWNCAGGLLGQWVETAEFTNCGAEKCTVTSSAGSAGGLAGSGDKVTLTDCTLKGDISTTGITGSNCAGGMVGQWAETATFTRCSAENLPVTSSAGAAGGLAGSGKTATFTDNCIVKGVDSTVGITGQNYAGGLLGQWTETATFNDCHAEKFTVTSPAGSAGGMAGNGNTVTFEKCTVGFMKKDAVVAEGGTITGLKHAGGLVGYWTNTATFTDSHARDLSVKNTGSSNNYAGGGLAGSGNTAAFVNCTVEGVVIPQDVATVEPVYTTSITGYDYAGGLVGYCSNRVTFEKCHAKNLNVKNSHTGGTTYAGGLAGNWAGTAEVKESYVKNLTVNSQGYAGGLAGFGGSATFSNCNVGEEVVINENNGSDKNGVSITGSDSNTNINTANTIITGSLDVGGLIGMPGWNMFHFKDCHVEKTEVKSTGRFAGGLAGQSWEASGKIVFEKCSVEYLTVDSEAAGAGAGGLVGRKGPGEIEFISCEVGTKGTKITVTGKGNVGGLLGDMGWDYANTNPIATFTKCTVGKSGSEEKNIIIGGPENGNAENAGGLAGNTMGTATFLECNVNNITVGRANYSGGLTGMSYGGTFSDCTVSNTNVNVNFDNNGNIQVSSFGTAGGLVGQSVEFKTVATTFMGCSAESITVTGTVDVGGLAGHTEKSIFRKFIKGENTSEEVVKNCTASNITVISNAYAGGLTGNSQGGSFSGCKVDGAWVKGKVAGGLTGNVGVKDEMIVQFTDCHTVEAEVTGTFGGVESEASAGGLAGTTTKTNFQGCTVGEVNGKKTSIIADTYAGGLTGNSVGGSFEECKAYNATVIGDRTIINKDTSKIGSNVGGLTGRATGEGADTPKFENCTANKIYVEGGMNAGGLVGGMENVGFTDCNSKEVEVSAIYYAGGLTGNAINGSFTNCEAVNVSVRGDIKETGSEAGGLVGRATGSTSDSTSTIFTGCEVYWENDALSNLKNSSLNYQICATTAGGLVGSIRNGGEMENSFAATLVQGVKYAGGLVGFVGKSENAGTNISPVNIRMSYADCYLQATGSGTYAGGLIGIKDTGATLTLENVYAAGFIQKAENAAGLCGGDTSAAETTIRKAYAAMYYTTGAVINIAPLSKKFVDGGQCYFLKYNGSTDTTRGKTYTEMRAMAAADMGDGFRKLPDNTGAADTYPYGLSAEASGDTIYPFPCLKDLPHYGDWVDEPKAGINAIGEDFAEADNSVSGNGIPADMEDPDRGESGESQAPDGTVSGNKTPDRTPENSNVSSLRLPEAVVPSEHNMQGDDTGNEGSESDVDSVSGNMAGEGGDTP